MSQRQAIVKVALSLVILGQIPFWQAIAKLDAEGWVCYLDTKFHPLAILMCLGCIATVCYQENEIIRAFTPDHPLNKEKE